ncbi:hypothetical protein I79_020514 [Cricetulus griseus]|uniref:Uncharacterized protein n=1 Tax=Cricetulus griseus TaxID=10029 RepID=G3IA96_CRIGR|nr:hypothetical protein I79_020514 [Cricetulus griseus]
MNPPNFAQLMLREGQRTGLLTTKELHSKHGLVRMVLWHVTSQRNTTNSLLANKAL